MVYRSDVYRDGYPAIVFENATMRLIVSPCAGARAFVLEDFRSGENLFTTVGGLRDAWLEQRPASPRDYIAKYTHPIATGTFNRCYAASISPASSRARFTYTAPDAPPHGATFIKSVALNSDGFSVTLDTRFPNGASQRAQQLSSFAISGRTQILRGTDGVGFFNSSKHRLLAITWPGGTVESARVDRHVADALLTMTFSPGRAAAVRYTTAVAGTFTQAQALLTRLANRP